MAPVIQADQNYIPPPAGNISFHLGENLSRLLMFLASSPATGEMSVKEKKNPFELCWKL